MVAGERPKAQIEIVTTLGAVVGTHAGPGTVGFFWFTDRLVASVVAAPVALRLAAAAVVAGLRLRLSRGRRLVVVVRVEVVVSGSETRGVSRPTGSLLPFA